MQGRPMRVLTFVLIGLAAIKASAAAPAAQEKADASTAPPAPPKEARRAFEKAAAALKAKRTDEAIRDYEQAVTVFPGYAEAWYELGKLRLEQQQPDAARKALESAIQADPKYAGAYMTLAILEHAARRWKQLVDVTDALVRLDAIDFPQAWLLNSVGNYNNRNLEAAEKSAREAERLDPRRKFPETWRLLGLILAQRGDFAGEADQFREYLRLVPSGPDSEAIRAKLAETAKRTGSGASAVSSPTFRTETTLAVVGFQLRQNKGQPIHNLRAEDIEIREDGVAQKIAVFEGGPVSARTVPVEISLLFDCSASVERIAAFGPHVFRESLLDEFPNASIAIYGFSDDLVRFARPTRDADALKKAMDAVAAIPKGDTPLFGSIADTVRDAATTGANVIRMLVIFSDGESAWLGDQGRAGEAARVAGESGTALFPVMLSKSALSMDSVDSIHDFMNLASATGGREFQGLMGTDVLPSTLKALAGEIRSGYVAGFYVPVSGEQKRHKIEVVLRSKDQGRLYGGSRVLVH
jgi:VWFA-related protein